VTLVSSEWPGGGSFFQLELSWQDMWQLAVCCAFPARPRPFRLLLLAVALHCLLAITTLQCWWHFLPFLCIRICICIHTHTHIQDSQTASSSSLQGHSGGLGSGTDRGWVNGRGQWLVTSAFLQEVVRFFIIPFLLFEFLQTLIALAFVQVKLIKRRKERVIITKCADYKTWRILH